MKKHKKASCEQKPLKLYPHPVKLYESTGRRPAEDAKPVSTLGPANPVAEMASKVEAVFRCIPETFTDFNHASNTVFVYTLSGELSEALRFFLRGFHDLGGCKLRVRLLSAYRGLFEEEDLNPAYTVSNADRVRMFKAVFKDGPIDPVYTQLVDQDGTQWDFFEFPTYGISFKAYGLENRSGRRAELIADLVKDVFATWSFQISSMG